jgi:hypothetical protein
MRLRLGGPPPVVDVRLLGVASDLLAGEQNKIVTHTGLSFAEESANSQFYAMI